MVVREAVLHAVTIGNAMVDIIASVDEEFLAIHHLTKASMMLVSDERSGYLRSQVGECITASGGSVEIGRAHV